jgi:putative sterol carrier protein
MTLTNGRHGMASDIRDLIESVLREGFNPAFEKNAGTFRFDVDGQGSWLIRIDHGTISVSKGTGKEEADCVMSCSDADFEQIITGRQHLLTAHMQGRLKIEGSPVMALRFIRTINSQTPRRAA